MRALQEQDFDKMASRVVDRFMNGSKLADAAAEEAMSGALGPDQIERLVQAANTQAFLRLMEQQKTQGGAPDMTHEFDPIDTRQIVQQLMGNVAVPHLDPAAQGPDVPSNDVIDALPNEHQPDMSAAPEDPTISDEDGPFPKGEKQKSKDKDEAKSKKKPAAPPEKDEPKEAAFRDRRRHKLIGILEDQYKQAEWAFEDEMARITQLLKVAYRAPELATFEKDALALDGSEIGIVVQNMVRVANGWPALSHDDAHAKHAALEDRHCVIETPTTRSFERLAHIATEANKLRQAAEHLRSQCA